MLAKRLFDLVVAFAALVVLAPFFLVLAALIRLDSPGSIFYKANRIGRRGQPFKMYKFRTMYSNADAAGPGVTYKDDPRITRVGGLLRKLRIDELPQLINVLKGDMSLVGPRPEAPKYVDLRLPIWQVVLSVRPGICGYTQLAFAIDEADLLASSATADYDYATRILPVKLHLDVKYIHDWSLLFDLKLIAQTVLLLLRAQLRPYQA